MPQLNYYLAHLTFPTYILRILQIPTASRSATVRKNLFRAPPSLGDIQPGQSVPGAPESPQRALRGPDSRQLLSPEHRPPEPADSKTYAGVALSTTHIAGLLTTVGADTGAPAGADITCEEGEVNITSGEEGNDTTSEDACVASTSDRTTGVMYAGAVELSPNTRRKTTPTPSTAADLTPPHTPMRAGTTSAGADTTSTEDEVNSASDEYATDANSTAEKAAVDNTADQTRTTIDVSTPDTQRKADSSTAAILTLPETPVRAGTTTAGADTTSKEDEVDGVCDERTTDFNNRTAERAAVDHTTGQMRTTIAVSTPDTQRTTISSTAAILTPPETPVRAGTTTAGAGTTSTKGEVDGAGDEYATDANSTAEKAVVDNTTGQTRTTIDVYTPGTQRKTSSSAAATLTPPETPIHPGTVTTGARIVRTEAGIRIGSDSDEEDIESSANELEEAAAQTSAGEDFDKISEKEEENFEGILKETGITRSEPLTVAEAQAAGLGPCSKCHRDKTAAQFVYRAGVQGRKYHTDACRHGDPEYSLTLTEAQNLGMEPCGQCHEMKRTVVYHTKQGFLKYHTETCRYWKKFCDHEDALTVAEAEQLELIPCGECHNSETALVYVSQTAGKAIYHTSACRYGGNPEKEMSLKRAQDQGLSPCTACHRVVYATQVTGKFKYHSDRECTYIRRAA